MAEVSGKKISGWLQKRGEKGLVKNFKKRWFVFNADEAEKRVYYYPTRDDLKELGYIALDHVTEIRKTSSFDFEVVTPTRIYFLQAPTEKELESWVTALRPHTKGGSGGAAASSEALREKDEKIAKLEAQVKALQGQGGGSSDESKLRLELASVKEEFERYKASSGGGGDSDGVKKDEEIQALQMKIKKMEEAYNEELVELKKEYFRACAIGIVQQRKITKDLPPVAELYKRCLDDNTEWKDYVPWIKTTLPKK